MRDATADPGEPSVVSIDAIPNPVLGYEVADTDPVIAVTNEAFEESFGETSPGAPVEGWLERVTPEGDAAVEELCATLARGGDVDAAMGLRSADGRTAATTRYRMRSIGGSAAGAVDGYLLLDDVRSRRGADVGAERIASVVSHDLRNPLDVAKAHLRAARETGNDEHFDEVRRSHDRMERIVQDVLTLARGRRALDVTADVDVEAVAADAWATVDTDDAALTFADDLPTIDADPDRLQRLFENLFRNGVEHARGESGAARRGDVDGDGDGPLQVRVGSTERGFFVADDGVGIPAEEADHVFDPGYSANETANGTGLGLTIVERVAQSHGWTVSLTTASSGGARFEFETVPDGRDGSGEEATR